MTIVPYIECGIFCCLFEYHYCAIFVSKLIDIHENNYYNYNS